MKRVVIGLAASVLVLSLASTSGAADPVPYQSIPASLSLKVYRFGLSASPTCENLTIYSIENPAFADFTKNPELGTADVPKGTYHCIALEMDTTVAGTPMQSVGTCVAGQEAKNDLCYFFDLGAKNPSPDSPFDGIRPLDGGEPWKVCKPGGDRLVVYLTTQITAIANSNAGRPPESATDTKHGYPLGAPLIVGDHTTGTLIVTSNVQNDSAQCLVGNPTFSFESTTN